MKVPRLIWCDLCGLISFAISMSLLWNSLSVTWHSSGVKQFTEKHWSWLTRYAKSHPPVVQHLLRHWLMSLLWCEKDVIKKRHFIRRCPNGCCLDALKQIACVKLCWKFKRRLTLLFRGMRSFLLSFHPTMFYSCTQDHHASRCWHYTCFPMRAMMKMAI